MVERLLADKHATSEYALPPLPPRPSPLAPPPSPLAPRPFLTIPRGPSAASFVAASFYFRSPCMSERFFYPPGVHAVSESPPPPRALRPGRPAQI